MNPDFKAIVRKHLPRGYRLHELEGDRQFEASVSSTTKTIRCRPIIDNYDLFIFLHECGHVHLKHVNTNCDAVPFAHDEYEADQYAIRAIRASEFSLERECIRVQKQSLREIIEYTREYDPRPIDDDEILKYAYGREWRKHR